MAMTVAEADAVSNLVRFIVSGEMYTGQPESAAKTAAKLVYLAARAEKILQLNLPGDEATYAERLEALAPRQREHIDGEPQDCPACQQKAKPDTSTDLRRALKKINRIHIEWGSTPMTEANVVALHERLGRTLREAGI